MRTIYKYTARSGVRVESSVPPVFDSVARALWGEYRRWFMRLVLGKEWVK